MPLSDALAWFEGPQGEPAQMGEKGRSEQVCQSRSFEPI
jgi:hypothetical protein